MSTTTADAEQPAVHAPGADARQGVGLVLEPRPPAVRAGHHRQLGVAAGLSHDVLHGLTGARTLRNHYRRLLDVGIIPAAASKDVRTLAVAFGYPVPKEALASADADWERRVDAFMGAAQEPPTSAGATVKPWRRP